MLLKFSLNEFKADREYRNISPRTLESYMATLNEFHAYCIDQEIVNLEDCTSSLVKGYLIYCGKDRKNKNVRLSAHTFRHTAAHRMLMAGADVGTIQKTSSMF